MYVQIASQSVAARADTLLNGYISPFTGARTDNPTVFAGFVLANSETGHGSFSITPRLVAQVCSNGYTITRDAMRALMGHASLDTTARYFRAGAAEVAGVVDRIFQP